MNNNRPIVITGSGRTATKWLADMIALNVEDVIVSHEAYSPCDFSAWGEWLALVDSEKERRVIDVNSHARHMLPLSSLWEFVRPVVVFLWRDPVDLVRSALTRRNFQDLQSWPPDVASSAATARIYGELEVVLANLAPGVFGDVRHSHFDHYTTEAGFRALMASLRLKLKGEITMLPPRNKADRPRPSLRFCEDLITEGVASFTLCRRASEEARRCPPRREPPWDDLDEGIREMVCAVWECGYDTVDSGDGTTDLECGFGFPHVVVEFAPKTIKELDDALADLEILSSTWDEGWSVEASRTLDGPTLLIMTQPPPSDLVAPELPAGDEDMSNRRFSTTTEGEI